MSHAILLPCDTYICIWNKNNFLLHINSLGPSSSQGLFVQLQYINNWTFICILTNIEPQCSDAHGTDRENVCIYVPLCTPASQHYLLWDYNNTFTATVPADHDKLQSKHFCCFHNHRNKRTKKVWCVQRLFLLAREWDDDGTCIESMTFFPKWHFFPKTVVGFVFCFALNCLCGIKLVISISWTVL